MAGEEEDWAAELTRDEGHPAVATIISSFILLLATCSRPDQAVQPGPERLGYLVGGILASIAIFWGIPYLIAIKKASRGWKIGTFVAIAVLAVLTNLWALGTHNQRLQ